MSFSLRAFLLIFTLIAIYLGIAEAVRQYHWHRNMPVVYHLGAENAASFPGEIKVVFESLYALRTQTQSANRQHVLADEVLADQIIPPGFWQSVDKDSSHYGFGEIEKPAHFRCFDPLYAFSYPEAVRSQVAEKLRQRFLGNPDLADEAAQLNLANWNLAWI